MRRKWVLVGVYWIAQAAVWYFGWPLLIAGVGVDTGEYFSWSYARGALAIIAGLTTLQYVFVRPIRKPRFAMDGEGGRWSVRVSLAVAGLAIALLGMAAALTIVDGFYLFGIDQPLGDEAFMAVFFVTLAAMWAVATPLLVAFCRRGPRQTTLNSRARFVHIW